MDAEEQNAMKEFESFDYSFEIESENHDKKISFQVYSYGVEKEKALALSSYMQSMKEEIKRILLAG